MFSQISFVEIHPCLHCKISKYKKMKNLLYLLLLLSIGMVSCNNDDEPGDAVVIPEGYTLLWQDEFNSDGIDNSNWSFENGDGTDFGLPAGWGNNELQLYTDGETNAKISSDDGNSVLELTAVEAAGNYTSAKIVSKNKFSMRFGRIEVQAKLPQGQGIWPAIWMLGDNIDEVDWPGCGEIDIMELLGNNPSKMYSTVHYVATDNKKGETQGSYALSEGTFSDSYHIFSMEWTPQQMTFFVDGNQMHQVQIQEDMKEFQRGFYLIANIAVGGYWPGNPDNTTTFPQSMMIDYIRVFEKIDFIAPEAPALDLTEESIGQAIEANIGDNAVQEGFDAFGNIEVISYGAGGEPVVSTSETAIDGSLSLAFDYPGGNWGGGYIEMANRKNVSGYSSLKFSLHMPDNLVNAELKLESAAGDATVFLENYTGVAVADGFMEFTIPLADFEGLDFSDLRIPFSLWNPTTSDGEFVIGMVLIDNLYLE